MSKARLTIALILFSSASACAVDGASSLREEEQINQQQSSLGKAASFDVDFLQCTEVASLAPVPVANVRALVPSRYTLANEANGTTFIVVRVADCADAIVDAKADGAGTLAQVGVNLVSPDGSGDIDNYTLWYYTTSARLHAKLRGAGVPAQHVKRIDYVLTPTSTPGTSHLAIAVPGSPSFSLDGDVVTPTGPATMFQAGWWRVRGQHETVMNTSFPMIQFSSAAMTLTTSPSSDLGRIIGGSTTTFPIFDSHNTFASAHMTTTRSP